MNPEQAKLLERINKLEKSLFNLNDVFYRQHFIDKDVFQNPVYIQSKFKLKDLTADPGTGEKGEICSVNGKLKICTVSSSPGVPAVFVIVGTQT